MIEFDPGSFKDPAGRVFYWEGRVFRTLAPAAQSSIEAFLASPVYDRLATQRMVVPTAVRSAREVGLHGTEVGERILEHQRIPFITYPYEWSFDMLRDAARLVLRVFSESFAAGYTIKDGTGYNVQFLDGKPVWIDLLSFEPYRAGEPWAGYSQFCATCLYPLLLTSHLGVEFHAWLRGALNGFSARDVAKLFRWSDMLKAGVLAHVFIAAHLERSFGKSGMQVSRAVQGSGISRAALAAMAARLSRLLDSLRYGGADSVWANYTAEQSYDTADLESKKRFVLEAITERAPRAVWDLGCNTGEYSTMVANRAELVLGIDVDPAAINRLYTSQRSGRSPSNILPIVGDMLNPSPAVGWELRERSPWMARGSADFFLSLALVHHLAIGGNVPLERIVRFLRDVAPSGVVEFVSKRDDLVKGMLANRADVFHNYDRERFEALLASHFEIRARIDLKGGARHLYAVGPSR